jgi:uncharacterized protein
MFGALLLAAIALSPAGHVNDFAQMLRPETVSGLEAQLSQFESQSGNEVAIVTVATLPTDETIETYAVKIFEEWGIGKEKEDNGVLLLIARDDHEMRIEVGYGLEPEVTDIESGRIIREILAPAFQAGEYDKGVADAVSAIISSIETELAPAASANYSFPIQAFLFVLIFLASILGVSKSWWAGGIVGAVIGWIFFSGLLTIILLALLGFAFDFIVSRLHARSAAKGGRPPWWFGGGGSGKGGGFGGFGGGMSGGGGASGRW